MTAVVDLAIAGLGPGGMAVLGAAREAGTLDRLAGRGLRVIDPAIDRSGVGRLGDYAVRSDTSARVFAECAGPALRGNGDPALLALLSSCEHDGPVALSTAARLLSAAAGATLAALDAEIVVPGRVVAIRPDSSGVTVEVAGGAGIDTVRARAVIVATGGRPHVAAQLRAAAGSSTVTHSDEMVCGRLPGGLAEGALIVVVGGAHSAFSATRVLLERRSDVTVTIVHRAPIRVTYADAPAARADGAVFGAADICPQTGRVHRYGGLRGDSAELYRAVRDGREPRVALLAGQIRDRAVATRLAAADLVVAATGYREAVGALLRMPTPDCRFDSDGALWADGSRVPRVYGIGLGAGRRRDRLTGGEASFGGRIDGVWFYQHVVAPRLLERLAGGGTARGT